MADHIASGSLRNHTVAVNQVIEAIALAERRCRLDTVGLRLPDLAFAETFLAGSRVDASARLRWLLDLLEARAITGRARNFSGNFTCFFHKYLNA